MVFGKLVSSPRSNLSLGQSLELANIYLENARRVQDPDIALALCHDTEATLSQAKKSVKRTDDQASRRGLAMTYIGLGKAMEIRGHHNEAQESFKKAERLGVKVQDQDMLVRSPDLRNTIDSTNNTLDSAMGASTVQPLSSATQKKRKQGNDLVTVPSHIFAENVAPTTIVERLPDPDERLTSTPQLASCLGILKNSRLLDDILQPDTRKWLHAVENDEDEQERLKVLATDVIRTFKKDEIKDARSVNEVVCLAPVLEKDLFRDLLMEFYNGVDHSGLLDFYQVEGLAQIIQGASPGYLHADDLVRILRLLTTRLRETHKQSPQHMYQLTLAASYVLDAMADTSVEGLDRETLHEPLLSYLDSLKGSSDPFLIYQAAYAYQALLCVPDNETLWQATFRRAGKVIKGVSGLVSAVKGFDLKEFIDGLKDIQQGLAGASDAIKVVISTIDDVKSLTSGGKGLLDGLKEGFSFQRKCTWYPALRGADALIHDGELVAFKQLVCEAPCRLDPAFQWGVCQRFGEIAVNSTLDAQTRRGAIAFLGEMYHNDDDWGYQQSTKEWILIILVRLSSSKGSSSQYAEDLVRGIEANTDAKGHCFVQACRDKNTEYSFPLNLTTPTGMAHVSILDRVQNKPNVEGNLRLLRKQRLKERGNAVYIQPQAKASLQSSDDNHYPLMENVKEFLGSERKVYLLLGDSGAGKSTFTRQLEYELWQEYKKNTGRIPLYITLPAIDKPEQDMIAKHLRKSEFNEPEIRELKTHRRFILICDGYDESQQTHNLYMSNRLNQPGEWSAQMIVSCRSEYLGVDYRDKFQPGDRNSSSELGMLQEAVLTPFSENQVNDYIKQYVLFNQTLWDASQYTQALQLIPSLMELVKNPFLMVLSLEVLPRMVDSKNLSAARVTRVALYDQFIEHWLERGKKRLGEKEMSPLAKAAFESLVEDGFTRNGIDFIKKLAVAIYKEQRGQPIVQYSRFKDEGTWKAAFFSREDEKHLLREAIPLTRSGNQHRFIHRSLLEYGLARAVFDPQDWKEKVPSAAVTARRGSTDSALSFLTDIALEEGLPSVEHEPDASSPLIWRNYSNDLSILQFLTERVQQEPIFKDQLLGYIEYSKTDVQWRKAAANAITILIRAGVEFNGADLRGIRVPGADLSYGMFDSAQLQGADLRHVNLRSAWLRQSDLSGAVMTGAHFWEGPVFQQGQSVYACAYSPDGMSLAVGLSDGDISMYSTSNWENIRTLKGHTGPVCGVTYSPNGDGLASGSEDHAVRLWSVESEDCIRTLTGHHKIVTAVAYSPSGLTLASASDDCTVRLWDVSSGDCRSIFIYHTSWVNSVAFSSDGRQVASGSYDSTIRLWDSETGDGHRTLNDHTEGVWCVVYSPQGDRIASTGDDGTVRLWDVASGKCIRTLTGHTEGNRSVVFSPRGDLLVSSGGDLTVQLWSSETGDSLQVLSGHSEKVRSVVFSPNGDHIASGSFDWTVRLWVVGAGMNQQVSSSRSSGVLCLKYSPQGTQIASSHRDGLIRLWDIETGSYVHTLSGHEGWVTSIDYSPDGDLLVSGSNDETVRLWDVKTGQCRQSFTGHVNCVFIVAFSPQGCQVASCSDDGFIKLWDVRTGECTHTLSGRGGFRMRLVYSPNGNWIASSSNFRTARLWSTITGVCVHTLPGYITDDPFSPQEDAVFTSEIAMRTMRMWDLQTGECRIIVIVQQGEFCEAIFSPQGNQVATTGNDGTISLRDAKTWECVHIMTGHTKLVLVVKYSPNGSRIASGSRDMTVRLWNAASGQCLAVIQGFVDSITGIAWGPTSDARHFVTSTLGGSVQLWQVEESERRCNIRLCWRSVHSPLTVWGASIQGVKGLSQLNKLVLKQRGAEGEPYVSSRLAIKKVVEMASVISRLKNASTPKETEFISLVNPVDVQNDQQDELSDKHS